jgi:hypothetical protein
MAVMEIEPPEDWMMAMSRLGREKADEQARLQAPGADIVELVSMWTASVRAIVEATRDDYYDDYWIYVHWREDVDAVLDVLLHADAAVVLGAVRSADDLFREHTIDDGGRAISRWHPQVDTNRWYWRRAPIHGPIARSFGAGDF